MRITDINQLAPEEVRAEMARAEQEERLYLTAAINWLPEK